MHWLNKSGLVTRAKEICIVIGSMRYAKRDRCRDSCLQNIAGFIESQPKIGKWVCYPSQGGQIPDRLGHPTSMKVKR